MNICNGFSLNLEEFVAVRCQNNFTWNNSKHNYIFAKFPLHHEENNANRLFKPYECRTLINGIHTSDFLGNIEVNLINKKTWSFKQRRYCSVYIHTDEQINLCICLFIYFH